jgi:hypothetical protein
MKRLGLAVLSISLTAALASSLCGASDCRYPKGTSFVAGHDEKGFFVRADWQDPRLRPIKGSIIAGVGDYLARQAGATILYLSTNTAQEMGRGEWRSGEPLATLKLFADAAGLEVEVPSPGYWVIGPPDYRLSSALTLSTQPLDPAGQGFRSQAEMRDIEMALVNQLPVRDTGNARGEIALNVAYYQVAEEGPDIWLVLSSLTWAGDSNPYSPFFKAYKVRLDRADGHVAVHCVWESLEATGRLVPEIAEDFDGDGIRDFVFEGGGDKHPDVILSGSDGRVLLTFLGNELAVEKAAVGPKRFAVDTIIGMDIEGEPSKGPDSWREGPFVLKYDRSASDYEMEEKADLQARAQAVVNAPGGQANGPRKLLARALGGTNKVRVYLLYPGAHYPGGAYEEVPQQRYSWNVEVTPQLVAKGYPARILLRYESAGFVEKRKLREERRLRERRP